MPANVYALGAIALWSLLASLGVALQHLPPFLLTGLALLIGSVLALPAVLRDRRAWRVPARTLLLGVYGLFGFHFLLFLALRLAPPVQANLVNYLWPLLLVVLAPAMLPGMALRRAHVAAAALGFAGAALAILGADTNTDQGAGDAAAIAPAAVLGYVLALGSAFIWASYSLLTRRVPAFPTAAIGLFGAVSGVLSLLCHWALEPSVTLSGRDGVLLAVMGLGPLGAAFFWWDQALKRGDPRQIGVLSYLTPLASTVLLVFISGRPWNWSVLLAGALIVGAAVIGTRSVPD